MLFRSTLAELIDRTRFAISTEETRYYLNGIYLHAAQAGGVKVLRAVATDGHRLARVEMPLPSGAEGVPGVILPRKTVMELRKLLDEAGWKLTGDARSKDGQRLEIRCVIPGAVQVSRQESELIQNMLARVGIKVNIDTVPASDFFDKYVNPGQFDITLFSWIGTAYPMSSAKSIYVNPQTNANGEVSVQQNFARVGSPEIDALLVEAAAEFDRTKALEIANRTDALIWQEVHSLTLYQRPELVAVKKGFANFGAFGLQTPWPYSDLGWVAEP